MKKLTLITGLISIFSLLFVTAGCGDDEDGWEESRLAATFSIYIVDENDTNLLDPINPDNIVDKVDMEVECSNGDVIPVLWFYDAEWWPPIAAPGTSKDNPYAFDYDAQDRRLIVGYWDNDAYWETSFKIRIPAYGIVLNVHGSQTPSTKDPYLQKWRVDGVECGRSFKLTLPIK